MIILNILVILALILGLFMVLSIVSGIVMAINIRKYGTWWGNLPNWLANLMDAITI